MSKDIWVLDVSVIVMVFLIALHWLGFTADSVNEQEALALIEVVQYILSGYVVLRGGGAAGEKLAQAWPGANKEKVNG